MQLRKFEESNALSKCFFYQTAPLIKISKADGITYHYSLNDKIGTLKERKRSDKFIIAWPGQWSTDVFEISKTDIEMVLAAAK